MLQFQTLEKKYVKPYFVKKMVSVHMIRGLITLTKNSGITFSPKPTSFSLRIKWIIFLNKNYLNIFPISAYLKCYKNLSVTLNSVISLKIIFKQNLFLMLLTIYIYFTDKIVLKIDKKKCRKIMKGISKPKEHIAYSCHFIQEHGRR